MEEEEENHSALSVHKAIKWARICYLAILLQYSSVVDLFSQENRQKTVF